MGSFFSSSFDKSEPKILLLGLDNAGKTLTLCKLKFGNVSYVKLSTIPTTDFNVETIEYNKRKYKVYDLGGQSKLRTLWQYYLKDTKGIIYIIDSQDVNRLDEARKEHDSIMNDLAGFVVPLLVMANKQDKDGVASYEDVKEKLELDKYDMCMVQPTSAVTGEGVKEGWEWLVNNIQPGVQKM